MSHHIYHTNSFVFSSEPRSRSSKLLHVFTRDFGLIAARAQAVREVKSKLRFHLQDLSRSDISLVRGKIGWQIVGARLKQNIYVELKQELEKLRVAVRVFNLLQRLLQGEEGNPILFDVLDHGIGYLMRPKLSLAEVSTFEAILVLRLVHNLGYVGDLPPSNAFVAPSLYWDERLLAAALPLRREVIRSINRALTESHL